MTARMRDVAQRAGVSVKTVSNVINDYPHVTPATRAKVEAAIAELDYRPNLGARSLRKGQCGVIALAIPDLALVCFAGLAGAVGRAAKKSGVAVLIEQTDDDEVAEELALDGLRDRLVDGILLWPSACAGTAAAPNRPVVLLGEGRPDLPFDRVSFEHEPSLITGSSNHEAFANKAVALLLDRVAGVGPTERRHVVIPSARPAQALHSC
ncbi:LacI family DNA-binding transcriptional regulator [Kribbella sp. NPDC049174]|uniref:LacI family DNA-binding transcriptional regulator n=1 Tax=Kribbella sp. NPDC049174 TaxID=3364112 RepID=UPI003714CC69